MMRAKTTTLHRQWHDITNAGNTQSTLQQTISLSTNASRDFGQQSATHTSIQATTGSACSSSIVAESFCLAGCLSTSRPTPVHPTVFSQAKVAGAAHTSRWHRTLKPCHLTRHLHHLLHTKSSHCPPGNNAWHESKACLVLQRGIA
jgi:hypothetical protein